MWTCEGVFTWEGVHRGLCQSEGIGLYWGKRGMRFGWGGGGGGVGALVIPHSPHRAQPGHSWCPPTLPVSDWSRPPTHQSRLSKTFPSTNEAVSTKKRGNQHVHSQGNTSKDNCPMGADWFSLFSLLCVVREGKMDQKSWSCIFGLVCPQGTCSDSIRVVT